MYLYVITLIGGNQLYNKRLNKSGVGLDEGMVYIMAGRGGR